MTIADSERGQPGINRPTLELLLTDNNDSIPSFTPSDDDGAASLPCIFPRWTAESVSDYRRMRPARREFRASQRRAAARCWTPGQQHLDDDQRGAQIDHARSAGFLAWEIAKLVPDASPAERARWAA